MAKIFSKKALALVLTVAMLMSCMVFSFSADAALDTRYINKFDNGTEENWFPYLSDATAKSAYHTYGSSTPTIWENGAMKLQFLNADPNETCNNKYVSGFQFLSQGTEGTSTIGNYTIKPTATSGGNAGHFWKFDLDYDLTEIPAGASVDLIVAFYCNWHPISEAGASDANGNVAWSWFTSRGFVYKTVATLTANDVEAGMTNGAAYFNLPDGPSCCAKHNNYNFTPYVFIKATDGYNGTLNGTTVMVDNVRIAACTAGIDDFPADPMNVVTTTHRNNFNNGTADNWMKVLSDPAHSMISDGDNKALFDAELGAMRINYVSASHLSGFWFRGDSNTAGQNATGSFAIPASSYVMVEFDYKVESFAANYPVSLSVGYSRNGYFYWDTGAKKTKSQFTNTASNGANGIFSQVATINETTGWVKATAYMKLPANYDRNVHFIVNQTHDSFSGSASVLIDNVKVHLCDESLMPKIDFVYGEETVASVVGAPGAPVTAPDFSAMFEEGVEFAGLYADAEFTTPAELPETFGNTGATYYIKTVEYLVNDPWSFEDIAHGTHISAKSNEWQGGARQVRNDYGSRTGSNALAINNENGAKNSSNNSSAARNFFILKNGSGNYAKVEVGKNYLLTYWVMVPTDAPSDFQGNLWVAAIGDPDNFPKATGTQKYQSGNSFPNMIFNDETTGYVTVPKDGNWHRVTRFISSANISKESETPNFTSRDGAVVIGLANMTSDAKLNAFVDDIDLICLDDMVAAEYEGGNDREQMLFETEVDGQKTHLHTNTRTGEGVYTSIRLAAKYKAGSAAGDTIILGGKEYALKERGMAIDIADNAATVGYNKSSVNMISTKADNFQNAWNVSEDNEFTFTVRLANISKDVIDQGTEYVYRSIYRVAMDGVYAAYNTTAPMASVPVQGAVSDPFTFADIYGEVAANGGSWFE